MADPGAQAENATRWREIISTVVLSALICAIVGLLCGKQTLMFVDGPWGTGWAGLLAIVAALGLASWEVVQRARHLLP
jgi:hypothetical protein